MLIQTLIKEISGIYYLTTEIKKLTLKELEFSAYEKGIMTVPFYFYKNRIGAGGVFIRAFVQRLRK